MPRRRPFGTAGSIPGIWAISMALEICLSLAERKEVIILSNGKNIYPEEVEAHYLKSPYVGEIAVMGLEGRPGEDQAACRRSSEFRCAQTTEDRQRERSDPLRH